MTALIAKSPSLRLRRHALRVMIVDDAVVVRGLFARWIGAESDLEMVAALRTGREAVNQLDRIDPDVVILDVDMPEIDGITALPLLLRKKPRLVVIMASTLTRRNAEISLRALSLGAADYIPKPESTREVAGSLSFRRELIEKIRHLGARARHSAGARMPDAPRFKVEAPSIVPSASPVAPLPAPSYRLRPFSLAVPRVLMIGASTGGPQALTALIPQLGGVLDRAPVLVTQHMPVTFTTVLAEHLQRASGRPVREAVDGEAVMPGTVYVAPGGRHMRVVSAGGGTVIALDDGPQINFCRPSVDPMFASGSAKWGGATLGLVLTGMGSDGRAGAEAIASAGGTVIAQDESSSVIWGMPGQAVNAGACSAVLPLAAMPAAIARLFAGERP
jgi:two-component system chemotaxis response regulator CheB